MPEAQSFKTIESQQPERTTPEGIRTAEAERVACAILQQRAEQICAPLVAEGKKPESRRDKMYGFFHTLKTLPDTPTPKSGVPEGVQEDKTDKGPPLTIRIAEVKAGAGQPRRFQVAESQDTKIKIPNSYNLEVKTIHYKDKDGMVYLTADRKGAGEARSTMEVAIHESELMMAYLNAEQQEILNDSELSPEQQKLLALQIKTFKEGPKTMANEATASIISDGAREAGLITRESIQKIAPTLSEEKVNSILGSKDANVATVDQTMRAFEEAGMFDVNEAKALQQEAAASLKQAQSAVEAASADLEKYAVFDGKVTGEVIQIDGQDYTITDTDVSNLQGARKAFETAQKELRLAQRDLAEVGDMVKKAGAGGEMEAEMKKYLLKIENGDIDPRTARKFLRGVETKNIDSVFEAVMEEKLNGIKDAQERERKKAEMQAKFKERRDAALKYGGLALMVLLMMMKDSAKQ